MSLAVYDARDLTVPLSQLRIGDEVVLGGAEGHHAGTVKRVDVGESLVVTDGRGGAARCLVVGRQQRVPRLRIEDMRHQSGAAPALVLVQALAKAGRDLQAVEAAVELGVDTVIPWAASRCQVKWDPQRRQRQHAKWVNQARAAAKQSRRCRWPRIESALDSGELATRIGSLAGGNAVLLAYEGATAPLPARLGNDASQASSVWVIVGPEGGIARSEAQMLCQAGAVPVSLGPTIMRTSSAGPAALAAVAAATGRWDGLVPAWLREERA